MSASRFNASIYARINGSRSLEPMKCKAQAALISDSGGREYRFTPFLLEFTRPIDRSIRITPFIRAMTKATRAKNIFVSNRIESNRIVSIVHVAAFPRDLTLYTFSGLGCRRTFALRCTVNSRRLRRGICDNRFVRKRFVYRTRFNKLVLSREIFKTTRRARR